MKMMRNMAMLVLAGGVAGSGWLHGEEAAPTAPSVGVSLDIPILSAYVWRGQVLNDATVCQPSLTVAKGGFSLNVWGNVNLTDVTTPDAPECTEIDLTPSYSTKVGPVTVGGGWVEYLFPHQTLTKEDGTAEAYPGTRELFMSAGLLDLIGAPTLTVNYDIDEIQGAYSMLSSSYGTKFLADKLAVSVAGSVGFGFAEYNKGYFGVDKAAFNDLTLTGSAAYSLPCGLTLSPAMQYVCLLDSEIKDRAKTLYKDTEQVVGSVKLSYAF